jgi:hypothetical protein
MDISEKGEHCRQGLPLNTTSAPQPGLCQHFRCRDAFHFGVCDCRVTTRRGRVRRRCWWR